MEHIYIVTERVKNNYKKTLIKSTIEEIKNKYNNKKVKVDHIIEIVKVTKEELTKLISNNEKYRFPYGLIIDDNVILCEELALYSIIDYENKEISIVNLNKYFHERRIDSKICITNISIFSVESMFINDSKILLDYCNGFHIYNRLDKKNINDAVKKAATKLLNMTYPSGKFIYCINALTGEKHITYNLLRHAGSVWSLINAKEFIDEPELENKIDNLINYLLNNYIVQKGNKAFLEKNTKKDGFSVGANALMLLTLTDYQLYFNNDKYLEIATKLGNGILAMQQPNGCYFQSYSNDLELVKQFECEYYDGETTLSLIKLYSITKDEKYLDSVMEALDYYIRTGFEKYSDHWMAYTLAEVSKYVHNEKIIEFAAKNVSAVQRSRFNPTRLESNVQLYRFYHDIKQYPQYANIIEEFPIEQVESNVKFYLKMLMSYYIGEEISIYMRNEEKVRDGFFCPTDDNRMRIDDIQHSLMGLMNYLKYWNDDNKESY